MSFRINGPKTIIVAGNPPGIPSGQDTQVLTKVNGSNIYSYPGYNYSGSDMFPVNNVDVSTIIDISRQSCGALSPNGFIYFGQSNSKTAIAKVNPYTNTVSYINAPAANYGLFGTGCVPNGKIFMLSNGISPHKILVIDTLNNDNLTEITLTGYSDNYWRGMVSFDKYIYLIPHVGSIMMRIDSTDNSTNTDISGITTTNYPLIGTNGSKFFGGAIGSDGKIYCTPANAFCVIRVDPVTKVVEQSSTNFGLGSLKYRGAVLANNNKIYMMPGTRQNVGIIDISSFTVDVSSITGFILPNGDVSSFAATPSYGKYYGALLGQSGKIYGIPYSYRYLEIDTTSNIARQIYPTTDTDARSTYGGVQAPNGKIYVSPEFETCIPIIKTGIPQLQPWMLAPSFNKSL